MRLSFSDFDRVWRLFMKPPAQLAAIDDTWDVRSSPSRRGTRPIGVGVWLGTIFTSYRQRVVRGSSPRVVGCPPSEFFAKRAMPWPSLLRSLGLAAWKSWCMARMAVKRAVFERRERSGHLRPLSRRSQKPALGHGRHRRRVRRRRRDGAEPRRLRSHSRTNDAFTWSLRGHGRRDGQLLTVPFGIFRCGLDLGEPTHDVRRRDRISRRRLGCRSRCPRCRTLSS